MYKYKQIVQLLESRYKKTKMIRVSLKVKKHKRAEHRVYMYRDIANMFKK